MKFDARGIPIKKLDDKLKALAYCIRSDSVGNPIFAPEDALGHLFDLINYVAPNYNFADLIGLAELGVYYGATPTPVEPND